MSKRKSRNAALAVDNTISFNQFTNARNRKNAEFDRFLDQNPLPVTSIYGSHKKFSQHDLINVTPLNDSQQKVFDLWNESAAMILAGSAGTGKSFLSLYLALNEILDTETPYNKLIIVRSAVPTREQGFLPGTQEEKNEIYELPYEQLFNDLFKRSNQYKFLKQAGIVEFRTTGNIRGLTWDNSIVLFDEFQSATYHELSTVATRIGKDSKVIYSGDLAQNDLVTRKNDVSGFAKFVGVADLVPDFNKVYFTCDDIVRSGFVRDFIIAEEHYSSKN